MKLFNGNKFVMDDRLHNELLKSAVSISKDSGDLSIILNTIVKFLLNIDL